MGRFTRGFASRLAARDDRLPPGQYDTGKRWPTLTAEVTPRLDTASWSFKIEGLVADWLEDVKRKAEPRLTSPLRGRRVRSGLGSGVEHTLLVLRQAAC